MYEDILEIPVDDIYFKALELLQKKFKIQYYNVRFGVSKSTNLRINKGNMRNAHSSLNYGFSVQAFKDGGYGFAVSNVINLDELKEKFEEAAKLAIFASKKAEKSFNIKQLDPLNAKFKQSMKTNLLDVSQDEKIEFLLNQDKIAGKYDKRIVNTDSLYGDTLNHQIIATSDQRIIDMTESSALVYVRAYSKMGDINQMARANIGITGGYEVTELAADLGETAAKRAIELLEAKPVTGGKYNIIIDPLLAGTFAHEAFGHASEADAVLANESQLAGLLGKKVGPDNINIIDRPDIEDAFGSIVYDSEGTEAKPVHLVKDGIMTGYLHSRETASKMDVEPTGNGRTVTYGSPPIVRMRNTYIEPGNWTLEEMLEELKNGILCINWNYGYTEPAIGQFMFKMERAWQIESGEKVQLLRDAALSGTMLEVLNKITALSKDKELDMGRCGKAGQTVPVGSGGPYIALNDIVLGGM